MVMTTETRTRPKVTYTTDTVYETKAVTKPTFTMEVRACVQAAHNIPCCLLGAVPAHRPLLADAAYYACAC